MKKVIIVRGPSGSGKSSYIKESHPNANPLHTNISRTNPPKALTHAAVVSADEFFMEDVGDIEDFIVDGELELQLGPLQKEYDDCVREYKFNPAKIGEAHAECFRNFLYAIEAKVKHIIVDNTNIRTWEYTNYIVAAKMHGYAVEIVEFRPITVDDIRVCIERNEHRVPADIVSRMCVEFEDCAYATVMPIVKE